MRGLKIIPLFLVLIVFSYIGVIFVQNNPDEMVIRFFNQYESPPLALGFIILTSALVGMVVAGILCVLELVVLYLQNKSLRRKLEELGQKTNTSFREVLSDSISAPSTQSEAPTSGFAGDGYTAEDDIKEEEYEEEQELPHPGVGLSQVPPPPHAPFEPQDEEKEDEDLTRVDLEIKSPSDLP
ncbi:MAG: LapA family protein [Bdellovibrionales bacterium]|nr:LapA family protein [Bdellovibrionales bacterium]